MRRFHVLLFTFLLALIQLSFAHKPIRNASLQKNNLRMNETLRTFNGKIDARSGVIRYLYAQKVGGYTGTAENIARAFINDRAQRFGVDVTRNELKTIAVKKSRGGVSVLFDQQYKGIPVFASRVVITLNKNNEVTFAASAFRPVKTEIATRASISESQAVTAARNYLQVSGKLIGRQYAEQSIFETADKGFRLCWRVVVPTEAPMGDWEIFVNAETGAIEHVKDMMMYHNGKGLVWDPDPLTTAGVTYGGAYKDNNDADSNELNDERMEVVLKDITYDGSVYKLEGPYAVLKDWESPSDNFPEPADSSQFRFTRNQQNFESVMAYYHVDKSTRHLILDLGYDEPKQHNFEVDPHGLSGDDNSHYVSSDNYLALGEGGVDDAEDADVIWHEHAHSFQTNLTGGMSYSGETMSLQEGSSDYWAASYSRITNDYNWGYVFSWDGHNEFWNGRRCDLDWVYPDDYVSGHDGGQIWSSALMDIWPQVGREVTDTDFIESHYIWGYDPGLQDAAQAYIQADENVYGGAHKSIIIDAFDAHGLVNKEDYMATITHTPLTDSEESATGYEVVATITAGADPLDPNRMWVVYGVSALTDSVLMSPTGNTNKYMGTIPDLGNNIDIQYYISVIDSGDNVSNDPTNAPTDYHSFHVGPDTENPVITHTALGDQALATWPATVTATVTDNMGVDTVICYYQVNGTDNLSTFPLLNTSGDTYEADFPIAASALSIGDTVHYYIFARDISSNQNTSREPASGFISFLIVDSKGSVLIVDDDPNGSKVDDSGKTPVSRSKDSYGKSADNIKTWLDELGYTTEEVTVSVALNKDFSSYDLIISSSGANTSPVSDSNYRDKLENWVADGSHKLLIEGGELGYDAISNPGYPSFASNVLHATTWKSDNSGNLQVVSGQSSHPIASTPNALPSSIGVSYSGYGDQDGVTPDANSYIVYEPANQTANAGILVYDNDSDETSAQIVYFAHNLDAITNSSDAKNLLENTVAYLLATPKGVISGTVDLTNTEDDSDVSVYLSGDAMDSTLTDVSGYYEFSGLSDGVYTVKVHKDGYTTTDSVHSGLTVNQDTVANNNYSLDPIVSAISGKNGNGIPSSYALRQNFPNPFNPTTTIRYQLPQASQVTLTVYNALGQKVAELVNRTQQAGYYSVRINARQFASGVYFYKLAAAEFVQMRKMLLVK